MRRTTISGIGLAFGAALLGALTGCVHDHRPHQAAVYAPAPVVYVDDGVGHDGYVYYPGYQVYYSSSRRHYVYRDGRAWVTRPSPPRVSVDVLVASPSVRLGFHDSPSIHHANVVRQYPRHWSPPGEGRGKKRGHDNRDQRDKHGHGQNGKK